jgi:hypothetical protein
MYKTILNVTVLLYSLFIIIYTQIENSKCFDFSYSLIAFRMGALRSGIYLLLGFYAGVYACQNYNIPKLEDPQVMLTKLQEYLKEYEKKPPKQ